MKLKQLSLVPLWFFLNLGIIGCQGVASFFTEPTGAAVLSGRVSWVQDPNLQFNILNEEVDCSNIPICALSYYAYDIDKRKVVLTNKVGEYRLRISARDGTAISVTANADCAGAGEVGLSSKPDFTSSGLLLGIGQVMVAKKDGIRQDFVLRAAGPLAEELNRIEALTSGFKPLHLQEAIDAVHTFFRSESLLRSKYPKSKALLEPKVIEVGLKTYRRSAEINYDSRNYEDALVQYTELSKVLPNSSEAKSDQDRLRVCQAYGAEKKSVDSLELVASTMSDKSKAAQILKRRLDSMHASDPLYEKLQLKVDELALAASNQEREKQITANEAEANRLQSQDDAALKRFRVNLSVSQSDFFMNPFAYIGKFIALTCAVQKFETARTAIMTGASSFVADFSVTPPTTAMAIHLIVRVKGVTELTNAFGARFKVPHVEVVHILNYAAEE